ncbi:MAG TPA: ABC transporter permease [Roseiflexaceae bacterium]|nr:ABC transporter permease [Roseiflexaceae bacterium]
MKRLLSTIRCDMRLQHRNGFYYATAVVVAFYALGLSQLHAAGTQLNLAWLLPAIVLNNLLITTFYFIGALVLLEKAEGTLAAQVVSPLRDREYLAAKVITLAGLALAYNLAVVALIVGFGFGMLALIAGTGAAAALLVMAGFVVVARYDSINEYLLPSLPYAAGLLLPMVYVIGWESPLLYLHPLQAPLVLMQAAFTPVAAWQLVYGVLGSIVWLWLGAWLCQRMFQRYLVGRAGS